MCDLDFSNGQAQAQASNKTMFKTYFAGTRFGSLLIKPLVQSKTKEKATKLSDWYHILSLIFCTVLRWRHASANASTLTDVSLDARWRLASLGSAIDEVSHSLYYCRTKVKALEKTGFAGPERLYCNNTFRERWRKFLLSLFLKCLAGVRKNQRRQQRTGSPIIDLNKTFIRVL